MTRDGPHFEGLEIKTSPFKNVRICL